MSRRARALIERLLPGGSFRQDVLVLFGGSALGQVVVLLGMPILSRMYSPVDFGVFAVFSTLESILVVSALLSYEEAVAAADSDDDAANLLGVALVAAAVVTVAVGAIVLAFAHPIADALGVPDLAPLFIVIVPALAADAGYQAFTYWTVRRGQYGQVARTKVLQGVGQSGAQVGLGAIGFKPGGLVVGWTLGRLVGTGRLVRLCRRDGAFRVMSLRGLRSAAYRFRRFPLLAAPAALLNGISIQAPALALAALYNPGAAGFFLFASRIVAVPMTLIGQSVSQAFIGRTSPARGADREALDTLVRRTVLRLAALASIPGLLLVVVGPQLFALVLGESWREAGVYARYIAPAFVAQFAVSPVAWVLMIRGRQSWQLAWDACRLVLVMTALLVPAAVGSARAAVAGYSAVLAVSYVVLFLAVMVAAKHAGPDVGGRAGEPVQPVPA